MVFAIKYANCYSLILGKELFSRPRKLNLRSEEFKDDNKD